MKCPECLGESFESGAFSICQLLADSPVVVKGVKGHKCAQCGYLLVSPPVMQKVQSLLASKAFTGETTAHVIDLASVGFAAPSPALER